MQSLNSDYGGGAVIEAHATELFTASEHSLHVRIDRMFAVLMILQWLGGVFAAAWLSPQAWIGQSASLHIHIGVAIILGGTILGFPLFLALKRPGKATTRYVIAAAQMLYSALLIHLTGGRIETHFQIFGLLAFLALYRDWRVMVIATLVVAVEHLLRGLIWPQSIYGVLSPSLWRWAEHAFWVLFEDSFLLLAIRQNRKEMFGIALRSAQLEHTTAVIERKVAERTVQLTDEIAARKQQEAELSRARDAALLASRLKAEFLANMSHEIRTPLNGIIGMTGLLLDTELDGERRDFVEIIRSCGDSLLTLINDILDFSKIEAGKLTFETLDFDIRSIVDSVTEMVAENAAGKRIELVSHIHNDIPSALRGDPGRLRQVLLNLIGNAIKFTEFGEVLIHTALKSETEHEAVIHFSVQDTGIGISPEVCQRLFHAFSQADGSTTRKYGGTGLGLAISKRLVEMMGGEIGVVSKLGAGSTFWFTARLAKQPVVVAEPEPPPADLRGLRVLIIDDNETNRRVLRLQLKSWNIDSEEACGAQSALACLRRERDNGRPFELALLDMQMPEVDGLELARRVRADATLAATRFILMTSLGAIDRETQLSALGISVCLIKPVRQSKLYDALVKAMLEREGGRAYKSAPKLLPPISGTGASTGSSSGNYRARTHILVAEDNPVNQKVILRQLAKLGYRADAVANGLEALAALEAIPYDIVLMDCQMPEMDGYTAAQEIRRREKGSARTYIIALTAHTMQGDREKCLTAGMDDFLSKPVKIEEMEKKLKSCRPKPEPGVQADQAAEPPVDLQSLEKNAFGDRGFMQEIIESYLAQTSEQIAVLRRALEKQETADVERVAHLLAGSSLTCGMRAVVPPLRQLESMARAGRLTNPGPCLDSLVHEFARVQRFLSASAVMAPRQ